MAPVQYTPVSNQQIYRIHGPKIHQHFQDWIGAKYPRTADVFATYIKTAIDPDQLSSQRRTAVQEAWSRVDKTLPEPPEHPLIEPLVSQLRDLLPTQEAPRPTLGKQFREILAGNGADLLPECNPHLMRRYITDTYPEEIATDLLAELATMLSTTTIGKRQYAGFLLILSQHKAMQMARKTSSQKNPSFDPAHQPLDAFLRKLPLGEKNWQSHLDVITPLEQQGLLIAVTRFANRPPKVHATFIHNGNSSFDEPPLAGAILRHGFRTLLSSSDPAGPLLASNRPLVGLGLLRLQPQSQLNQPPIWEAHLWPSQAPLITGERLQPSSGLSDAAMTAVIAIAAQSGLEPFTAAVRSVIETVMPGTSVKLMNLS